MTKRRKPISIGHGGRRQDPSQAWLRPLLIGLVTLLGLIIIAAPLWWFLTASEAEVSLPNETPTPFSSPTITPLPTIDPDLSERQLLSTAQRWSSRQVIGIDCVGAVCNQYVTFSLTFQTPVVLLEDMIKRELAGKPYTQEEFNQRLTDLQERLGVDKQEFVFLLVVAPGSQGLPWRGEIDLRPLRENLSLLTSTEQELFPSKLDPILDNPLPMNPVSPETDPIQGYIVFDNTDSARQPIINLDSENSLTLRLQLDDTLKSEKSVVLWRIDLVGQHRPDPLSPTPTPDPNAPTPEPMVDSVIVETIRDILLEVAKNTNIIISN